MTENQRHIISTEMKLARLESKVGQIGETLERMEEMFDQVVATRTHVAHLRDAVEELKDDKATKSDIYRISGIVSSALLSAVLAIIQLKQ